MAASEGSSSAIRKAHRRTLAKRNAMAGTGNSTEAWLVFYNHDADVKFKPVAELLHLRHAIPCFFSYLL